MTEKWMHTSKQECSFTTDDGSNVRRRRVVDSLDDATKENRTQDNKTHLDCHHQRQSNNTKTNSRQKKHRPRGSRGGGSRRNRRAARATQAATTSFSGATSVINVTMNDTMDDTTRPNIVEDKNRSVTLSNKAIFQDNEESHDFTDNSFRERNNPAHKSSNLTRGTKYIDNDKTTKIKSILLRSSNVPETVEEPSTSSIMRHIKPTLSRTSLETKERYLRLDPRKKHQNKIISPSTSSYFLHPVDMPYTSGDEANKNCLSFSSASDEEENQGHLNESNGKIQLKTSFSPHHCDHGNIIDKSLKLFFDKSYQQIEECPRLRTLSSSSSSTVSTTTSLQSYKLESLITEPSSHCYPQKHILDPRTRNPSSVMPLSQINHPNVMQHEDRKYNVGAPDIQHGYSCAPLTATQSFQNKLNKYEHYRGNKGNAISSIKSESLLSSNRYDNHSNKNGTMRSAPPQSTVSYKIPEYSSSCNKAPSLHNENKKTASMNKYRVRKHTNIEKTPPRVASVSPLNIISDGLVTGNTLFDTSPRTFLMGGGICQQHKRQRSMAGPIKGWDDAASASSLGGCHQVVAGGSFFFARERSS
eukprot:CAMPEP_0194388874 /NCGR_PEP_ID=MMETSP0174-20130528/100879_1 /TAXON_ID=216777 /ORGANISM="Proboscia alata, Strain PI-D3" /LENGTH=584 /DNA_ID=CAMNT_0039180579 /DNA_START=506 /DNA_END=2260 /DNA_ORIENTATION=-